jgi:hypothetical protein
MGRNWKRPTNWALGLQTVSEKVLKRVAQTEPVERTAFAHSLGEVQAISTALSKFNPADFEKHSELPDCHQH